MLGKDLEGDLPVQPVVFGEIDFCHTTLANFLLDFVMADGRAYHTTPPRWSWSQWYAWGGG